MINHQHPHISMQVFHTVLYTFLIVITSRISLTNLEDLEFAIISYILITLLFYSGMMLLKELITTERCRTKSLYSGKLNWQCERSKAIKSSTKLWNIGWKLVSETRELVHNTNLIIIPTGSLQELDLLHKNIWSYWWNWRSLQDPQEKAMLEVLWDCVTEVPLSSTKPTRWWRLGASRIFSF